MYLCDLNTDLFVLIRNLKWPPSRKKGTELPKCFSAQQAIEILLKLADNDSDNERNVEREDNCSDVDQVSTVSTSNNGADKQSPDNRGHLVVCLCMLINL